MSSVKDKIIKYSKNPFMVFVLFSRFGLLNGLSDEKCLKLIYYSIYNKKLNLKNPVLFSEKLQWLKLYDRKDIYSIMVDKYEAKKYVASIIGEAHIIPTLGIWNDFEQINFSELPENYVLKCTHDCGGLVICRNKNIDIPAARKKIKKSLNANYYYYFREWPYKNVKPRIIAEKYMTNGKEGLTDYKFYCFDGEPKFLYVSKGFENHNTTRVSFLNIDWTFSTYKRLDYKELEEFPEKPSRYNEMIEICRKLSKGMSFIRVDLYQIDNCIYFSELTFFPCGGFMVFESVESDREIGDMLIYDKNKVLIEE